MESAELKVEKGASNNHVLVYSPAALVSIFSKAFILQEEKKVIQIRGVFLKVGKESYGGFYYDKLKDESSDHTITLITSNLIHNDLKDNTTIIFNGFLTRKADKYGRIEFQLNFIELLNVTANKFSDEDIKKIEIINEKLKHGIKDIDSLIKQHVYNNQKIKLAIIIGKSSIIENDIKTALGTGIAHYLISYSRVSLSSVNEITNEIEKFEKSDVDIICVARGGGELMESFNQSALAKEIVNRKKIIASAIGHADDVTLFEKVADKKFTTPTAMGAYLKTVIEETVEELAKSKAKLQNDITVQLKTIYDGQIKNLNTKIDDTIKLYANEKKSILESHETYKRQLADLHEKKVRDLNDSITKLKSENDRVASQLNEMRQAPQTNYTAIIVIIIIVLIIILIFANK